MKLVVSKITLQELQEMSEKMFEGLVKAVVDIEREIMVVDAGMHVDEEELLLENGSLQENLWGINLRPQHANDDKWIEFDSMINVRPGQGNRSRTVEFPEIRKRIQSIVNKLVQK